MIQITPSLPLLTHRHTRKKNLQNRKAECLEEFKKTRHLKVLTAHTEKLSYKNKKQHSRYEKVEKAMCGNDCLIDVNDFKGKPICHCKCSERRKYLPRNLQQFAKEINYL